MYIVLDSNIWISEWGLNTHKGAATKFYIKQKKAKLALPEVIKEEVKRNLYNSLSSFSEDIQKNHRQLLAVFGQLKEVVLPSTEEIKTKVNSLFNEAKIEIHEVPFTLDSAKSSLFKIYDKAPPSDKNQQFKDGVVWADCMTLLKMEDVILVTEDKAFYKDKDYLKGLATNLKEEASACDNKFKIYSSLTDLLDEIKTNILIDNKALVSQFTKSIEKSMSSMLERNGFSISSEPTVTISSFVTEDPNRLYIEFEITFDCSDVRGEERKDCVLLLKGDGYYTIEKGEFLELRNQGEELSFDDSGEERKNVGNVMLAGEAVLGHRNVKHTIRYQIDREV